METKQVKQTMRKPEVKCSKEKYVSCVRINGVPILPPLITPEKSAAVKYYRKQALKIENQITERKKMRAAKQSQYHSLPVTKVHTVEQTKYTENILDCCRSIESYLSATYKIDSTDVADYKHAPKLTCDIQASQYINNELVLFDSPSELITQDLEASIEQHGFPLSKPTMQDVQTSINLPRLFPSKLTTQDLETLAQQPRYPPSNPTTQSIGSMKDLETTFEQPCSNEMKKPQLIRSNSYVLETPSPVLIEHLKKNKDMDTNLIQRCWSSSDNIYSIPGNQVKPLEDDTDKLINSFKAFSQPKSDLNSTKTDSVSIFDTSSTETELKNMSDETHSCISDNEYKLKQFIDNNVPISGSDCIEDKDTPINNQTIIINNENSTSKKCEEFDSLKEILKNIPDEYSKQILEFLEKHKSEPSSANNDDKVEDLNMSNEFGNLCSNRQKYSTPNDTSRILARTPNETVYYSMDDGDCKIGDYLNKSMTDYKFNDDRAKDATLCKNNILVDSSERFEKAASVIGAAMKGYLTRRLLHTEKVQNLIDVIKEVLVCAVQLHSETLESIDEYDVELHRRLIQQVSAACFAFHDIFFNTSIPEQMSIIAMDRQKKFEKTRRPISNLSIQSTKSTPRKSTKTLFSTRSMSAF